MSNLKIWIIIALLFPKILSAQSVSLIGKVERIFDDTCSYCSCSPATIPNNAIYPVSLQINNLTAGTQNTISTTSTGFSTTSSVGLISINASGGTQYPGAATFDVFLIQQHILAIAPFNCPFTRIAADINNDGKISTFDTQTLQQFLIGGITTLPVPPWRFIPKAYVLSNNYHPDPKFLDDFWNNSNVIVNGTQYPFVAILKRNGKSYTYKAGKNSWMDTLHTSPLEQYQICDVVNYGFYGIASGDVDYSAKITMNIPLAPAEENQFNKGDNKSLEKDLFRNERYEVKITAVSEEEVFGFQIGIKFRENDLEFLKVKPENRALRQDERNFGLLPEKLNKGEFRAVWIQDLSVSRQGIAPNQEFELFSFNLKAKTDLQGIEDLVAFDSEVLRTEFNSFSKIIDPRKVKLNIKIRLLSPDED